MGGLSGSGPPDRTGRADAPAEAGPAARRREPLAITAGFFGLLGIAAAFRSPLAVTTGLSAVALVLATLALARLQRRRDRSGRFLSLAAIYLGVTGVLIAALRSHSGAD